MVVLVINRSDSSCGACKRSCMPYDISHETSSGWDQHEGCGATFTHVTTHYMGTEIENAVKRMRPDLIWLDPMNNIYP